MQEELNQQSFVESIKAIGGHSDHATGQIHAALLGAWSEPQRHYHTQQHLAECLNQADQAAQGLEPAQAAQLRLALWYHDAVYDVKAHDNEERSAKWARLDLTSLGVAEQSIAAVESLVLATRHLGAQEPERSTLTDLMLDIDLAILGAAPSRFDQYDAQVQGEYAWVPPEQYAQGRRSVMQMFLRKAELGELYRTEWARSTLLPQALVNLARYG